jgi:hypothetical protein
VTGTLIRALTCGVELATVGEAFVTDDKSSFGISTVRGSSAGELGIDDDSFDVGTGLARTCAGDGAVALGTGAVSRATEKEGSTVEGDDLLAAGTGG